MGRIIVFAVLVGIVAGIVMSMARRRRGGGDR
jgi:hypothetical protein